MSTEEPKYPREDVAEMQRFKKVIKNQFMAMDVQLPDVRFLRPHREHHHYDIHVTEPTHMTIINSFHFKTEEACRDAIAHVKNLLPKDELEDSTPATQDTPTPGGSPESA
jgi:hypothetical protein